MSVRFDEIFASPDGRYFAYPDVGLKIFDLQTGSVSSMPVGFPQGWAGQLVWAP